MFKPSKKVGVFLQNNLTALLLIVVVAGTCSLEGYWYSEVGSEMILSPGHGTALTGNSIIITHRNE